MADYKRFVSYMYQYERGVKKNNVGYARVEARNGECKITIHLQLQGQSDSIFPTYLIQRSKNGIELIYLGDSALINRVMDSRHISSELNIMNSGYRLSDIGGLLIFLSEDIFFGTEWDDKPIVLQEVLAALNTKADNGDSNKEEVIVDIDENDVVIHNDRDDSTLEESSNTLERAKEERAKEDLEELSIPNHKQPRGWKTIECHNDYESKLYKNRNSNSDANVKEAILKEAILKEANVKEPILKEANVKEPILKEAMNKNSDERYVKEEQKNITAAEKEVNKTWDTIDVKKVDHESHTVVEKEVKQLSNILVEKDVKEVKDEKEAKEILAKQAVEKEIIVNETKVTTVKDSPDTDKNISDNMKETEVNIENAELKKFMQEINEEDKDHSVAEHFFKNYTRIYPFEDNEITFCVKIEPKDIGYLPKEIWGLSTNSFLLHGFYSFHHLIFAKMNHSYGSCYVLGIPGIYHNRERFMARMFGFDNFKPIKKRTLKQGDFGYWYLSLNL